MHVEQEMTREQAYGTFLYGESRLVEAIPVSSTPIRVRNENQSILWNNPDKTHLQLTYEDTRNTPRVFVLRHSSTGVKITYTDDNTDWCGHFSWGVDETGKRDFIVKTLSPNGELAEKTSMDPGLAEKLVSVMHAARYMVLDVRNGRMQAETVTRRTVLTDIVASKSPQKGETSSRDRRDNSSSQVTTDVLPTGIFPEVADIKPLSREEGMRFVQTLQMAISAEAPRIGDPNSNNRLITVRAVFPSFHQGQGRNPDIKAALGLLYRYFKAMPEVHEKLTAEESDQRNFLALVRVFEELQKGIDRLFPLFLGENRSNFDPRHQQLLKLFQKLSKWREKRMSTYNLPIM